MMIQAVLSNRQHPEYGVVTIPFPIKNEDYDQTVELLEPLEIGDAVKRDCCVEEIRGDFPALKQLEQSEANLDELDYLAKRLDSFDDYEKTEFQGMASRLDLLGIDEFINLTFCCQEATVVTDFNNLESLGRRHYLTLGGGASMEEMQGKDFRSVALALLDGEVGRVTPYGVAYDNGFEMSQLYDGRNFPEYCYEDCIMEVEMSSRYASADSPATYLYLPITQIRQARALARAGGNFYEEMCLRFLESGLPEEVEAALNFDNESLTDLNEMCHTIQPLNQAEREKLGAVVLFTRPEQASQITTLAKELEQFDYVPKVRTPEEYGKYMIMDSGHYEYDENLAGYIDFAKYGKEHVENEQGQFNDRGYVSYHGTLSLDELMQGDPAQNMGPQLKME